MRSLKFKQVDAFTRTPFRGNPVAVVLGGGGLSTAKMQHIAKWTNLSETTFVLPSKRADYRLRIFSPSMELPFAGHPTIGSAHAALEAGLCRPKGGKFRQECGAGVLELSLEGDGIWVQSPEARTVFHGGSFAGELRKVIGAKFSGTPCVVSVGPVWIVADLGSAAAVDRLVPDMTAITRFTEARKLTGITVFGAARAGGAAIHVRSFAPAHGIPEDPVCGSGNISIAAYLRTTGQEARFGRRYLARQGMQLGRDGKVGIRFAPGGILLGGSAVTCVDGTLRI